MTTSRDEAIGWVHKYAIGGAVIAALPLPFTGAALLALEARLMTTIGEIYGTKSGGAALLAAKVAIALASRGLKMAGRKAEEASPKAAKPLVRAAVAAATIEAIGLGLVLLHEKQGAVREIVA